MEVTPVPDRRVFCAVTLISVLFPFTANATPVRELSSNERVEAQRAIERVYYSHLTGASKTFEQAVTQELIERKVKTYLKQSIALEQFWNTPVTAEMLRAEADRIGRNTKFPERLGEIRAALGHDSFLIQESLVRATLVDRLTRGFLAQDERIQGAARAEAEQIQAGLLDETLDPTADHARRTVLTIDPAESDTAASWLPPGEPNSQVQASQLTPTPPQPGEVTPLTEDPRAYSINVTLPIESGVSRVASYSVPKVPWEAWWADRAAGFDETLVPAVADAASLLDWVQSPQSTEPCLPVDKWDNGALDDVPDGRYQHVSVWTGTEMIIWGGRTSISFSATAGRYDPLTDTWRGVSLDGAPPMAYEGTAIWTGTEMIVWGGFSNAPRATGRYDPISNTWSPIATVGEPGPRSGHSAVWTGAEMIVWGGQEGGTTTSTGARYDPATDSWRSMPQAVFALARMHHTAVWTGREMIVWGGEPDSSQNLFLSAGARFDPATDIWRSVGFLNEPRARTQHTAVWANGVMIIWGGVTRTIGRTLNSDGARYDPLTDTWTPASFGGAPSPRRLHTAVWTGTRMVVWGGSTSATDYSSPITGTGALYDPSADTWQPTSQVNAPSFASFRTAVWTGSLMIVWGGAISSGSSFTPGLATVGGRYDPIGNSWTATSRTQGGLGVFGSDTIVWTGTEMLVWSHEGGRYDPMTDSWKAMSTVGVPAARVEHVAVWTGGEMVIWGGYDGVNTYFSSGGRYNPVSDSWLPTSLVLAPQARRQATAVWTGEEMIVWGGFPNVALQGNGGRYNPSTDTWLALPSFQAPLTVSSHTAVWNGKEMIVWGGFAGDAIGAVDLGARYEPETDMWSPLPALPADQARYGHTAVWTGSEMIVLGGSNVVSLPGFRAGWIYDRAADSWSPLDPPDPTFPLLRWRNSTVWTGRQMLIWGGDSRDTVAKPGVIYDRAAGTWSFMSQEKSPLNREGHSALWTGTSMIIWGGVNGGFHTLQTGGRYILSEDLTAPEIVATASPARLWPPNHHMVEVTVAVTVVDLCGSASFSLVSVSSNEPDDAPGGGDGSTSGDIQGVEAGTADTSFLLRAERDASGDGRVYSIVYQAVDVAGNISQRTISVVVPHDQGGVTQPLDLNVREDAAGTVVEWNHVPGALFYNVIRGELANMRDNGIAVDLGAVHCIEAGSLDLSTAGSEDAALPSPGRAFFYLAEYNDGWTSSYGQESVSRPRVPGSGGCR